MVVDDEFLGRFPIAEALGDRGHTVIESESAEKAVAIMRRERVDAVITDFRLPGRMNGVALVRSIRAEFAGTPVVMTSGEPADSSVRGAADWFFEKPVDPVRVCNWIEGLLAARSISA